MWKVELAGYIWDDKRGFIGTDFEVFTFDSKQKLNQYIDNVNYKSFDKVKIDIYYNHKD